MWVNSTNNDRPSDGIFDLCLLDPRGLSDGTREELDRHNIEIITVPYDKVQLNGGGIHCSTCPLIKDSI